MRSTRAPLKVEERIVNALPPPRILALSLVALVLGSALPARAEMDFEYAKALMAKNEPGFSTDDLLERFIVQLDQNPTTKIDSKLIKATFRSRQADSASLEKRKSLLEEAEHLYKEILDGDKKYKYYATAEKEAEGIISKKVITIKKGAQEIEKTNPTKARAMLAEAVSTVEQIAAKYKVDADAGAEKFKAANDKVTAWRKANKASDDKAPPKELLEPLNKIGDEWIIADKHYVAAKVEQLECYFEGDKAKKTLAEELAKLCESRITNEVLSDFPVITLWYSYMEGRIWAQVQEEEKAGEAWKAGLGNLDMQDMNEQQKKQVVSVKKMIIQNLVKMKMRAKKYSDVEAIVTDIKTEPTMRSIFDEYNGKDLMIDYVKALTLPADTPGEFERAVGTLKDLIAKETVNGVSSTWANTYARTMAEILEDARNKGLHPKLSAEEWYNAARGFFVMGQNEHRIYTEMKKDNKVAELAPQFEKAYSEFQNAVDYYRRAITEARSEKTDLLTRVTVEPKAWFEMGLSYVKMENYYEAMIAYRALRDSYLPERRSKWIPDPNGPKAKPEIRKVAKQLQAQLADLDKPKEGLVAKGGANIMYAIHQNVTGHKNPEDRWNKELEQKILGIDPNMVDDKDMIKDLDYATAKNEMDTAKSLADAGKKMENAKNAEENFNQAAVKWSNAGDKFLAIKPASKAYEFALYQAGTCFTLAQNLFAEARIKAKSRDEQLAQCKELGKKALVAYQKYDEWTTKMPATEEKDKTRRQAVTEMILLARNAVYVGNTDWPEVAKSADEYIAWESSTSPAKSSLDIVLLNKFRALIEQANDVEPPKCTAFLVEAEKALKAWRKQKPKENSTYAFMLEALSYRNNMAAFQAQRLNREKPNTIPTETLDAYEDKVAEMQAERMDLEESTGTTPSLEDYSRLVYLFMKTHRDRRAVDVAAKLLDKYDPTDNNVKIPDDEKVWQEMLKQMQYKVISYQDLVKDKRCKTDHITLIDYMYDTREGAANAENKDKRPEFDKYNADMDKASAQLDTIKKNYPDCLTLSDPKTNKNFIDPTKGRAFEQVTIALNEWADTFKDKYPQLQDFKPKGNDPGKSFLGIVEEEIDFRRKVKAARKLIARVGMALSEQFDKDSQPDDAKKYRGLGIKQIEILLKEGEKPDLMIQLAASYKLQGQYDEAVKKINEALTQIDDNDPSYFPAKKLLSEVYRLKKNYRDALDYPESTARLVGFNGALVKDNWKDMKQFMKDCYAEAEADAKATGKKNAAEIPADVKKLIEDNDNAKDDVKKEEPKPADAPKADAPKADAPKADAPKDELKKEEPKADQKPAGDAK